VVGYRVLGDGELRGDLAVGKPPRHQDRNLLMRKKRCKGVWCREQRPARNGAPEEGRVPRGEERKARLILTTLPERLSFFPPQPPSLRRGGKEFARGTLNYGPHTRNIGFSSKLFKVHAPPNFRNRVFKGKTKHASITTQTNLDFVLLLVAGAVSSFCVALPTLKTMPTVLLPGRRTRIGVKWSRPSG